MWEDDRFWMSKNSTLLSSLLCFIAQVDQIF